MPALDTLARGNGGDPARHQGQLPIHLRLRGFFPSVSGPAFHHARVAVPFAAVLALINAVDDSLHS